MSSRDLFIKVIEAIKEYGQEEGLCFVYGPAKLYVFDDGLKNHKINYDGDNLYLGFTGEITGQKEPDKARGRLAEIMTLIEETQEAFIF